MSWLPASIRRIRSKTSEKRWRHHFPNYKSLGAFCCHGNQSFDPVCPKTLCSLLPNQMMPHIKLNQEWPTGIRDIQVQKCEIFVTQGQVTPKWLVWFGPKSNSTELLCLSWLPATLMMIRSKMNKLAWRQIFSHFKPMGNFLDTQRQLTPSSVVRSGQNSNSSEILCMSLLPASIKRIGSKATIFPIISQWGFLLAWTPEFWSNLPQNIMQPFPTPSDATHKIWSILAHWPQKYWSSKV